MNREGKTVKGTNVGDPERVKEARRRIDELLRSPSGSNKPRFRRSNPDLQELKHPDNYESDRYGVIERSASYPLMPPKGDDDKGARSRLFLSPQNSREGEITQYLNPIEITDLEETKKKKTNIDGNIKLPRSS